MNRLFHPLIRNGCMLGGALLVVGAALPARAGVKFDVPSGKVTYAIKGGVGQGTSTLTWAENGKKFRQDSRYSLPKSKQAQDSWVINDGTNFYIHTNVQGKRVTRVPSSLIGGGAGGAGLGMPMMGNNNQSYGKAVGKGTVLGRECSLHAMGNSKVWLWKGVPLKMELNGGKGRSMTWEATAVDAPAKADPTLFKLPSGYDISDLQMSVPAGKLKPSVPSAAPVR